MLKCQQVNVKGEFERNLIYICGMQKMQNIRFNFIYSNICWIQMNRGLGSYGILFKE